MSLFENSASPTSFDPPRLKDLHHHRPVLKRSRAPYYNPITEDERDAEELSKRRRTSPTGAFSRLSLSPTSSLTRPSSSGQHLCHSPQSSPPRSALDTRNDDCQLGPVVDSRLGQKGSYYNKEIKMNTRYSAYEPEPNRIIIDSLSDRSASPTPSLNAEDSSAEIPPSSSSSLKLDPQVSRHLNSTHQKHYQNPTFFFNSHPFLPPHPSDDHHQQQLVLYRKPCWPITHSDPSTTTTTTITRLASPSEQEEDVEHPFDDDLGPRIVELDPEILPSSSSSSSFQPESMDID